MLQVAAMVPVLDRDLRDKRKTTEVDITPLASSSYRSILAAMLEKRLKHVPVSFYAELPERLFNAPGAVAFSGWKLG